MGKWANGQMCKYANVQICKSTPLAGQVMQMRALKLLDGNAAAGHSIYRADHSLRVVDAKH